MAPEETPTEDGFVWLPEQRKAVRWEDPRYSGRTYATNLAVKHNGYFVKLVAPKALTADMVRELQDFIEEHAAGAEEERNCYWFGGDFHDAGQDFCLDCAKALVDEKYAADPKRFEDLYGECEDAEERYRAAIDGGFSIEHDSLPWCETCGAKLSGSLTGYGADQMIEAYTEDLTLSFDAPEDWDALSRAIVNLSDDDPRWRKIAKVVEAARVAEREKAAREAEIAASPGMAEARAGLLSLLAARAEQKAPEPSFRLWRTLRRWHRLPYERRSKPTRLIAAVEKRLVREAKRFAALLGYRAYWSGGLFDIEGPEGTYYWPFVVKSVQYALWNGPHFVAGKAVGLARLDADDTPGRDSNPFAKGDERAEEWDAGFMAGLHEAARARKAAP